jgi:hypothetical protein
MERVLLKEHNYPEWEEYIRDELLARALWGIVQGTTKPPRKPTPNSKTKTEPAAGTEQIDNEETPESTDSVYMSDFRRYLILRDTYNDKVGMATAEIRRSLDPSVRRRYADKKYITAPDVLWKDIEKDFNRVNGTRSAQAKGNSSHSVPSWASKASPKLMATTLSRTYTASSGRIF